MSKTLASIVKPALLFLIMLLVGSNALAREKVLYQFPSPDHGADPQYGLVFDSKGNAYGTTQYGGTYGWGTIFRLEPSNGGWTEEVLYSFRGSSDGFTPSGSLLIDAAGNLYGTTLLGGSGACPSDYNEYNCGTVFELAQSKVEWKHVILYNFCSRSNCGDGAGPQGLTFDTAGNLYGTTSQGGQECGCGTVYKLSPSHGSWSEKVLHAFGESGDGHFPNAGITIGKSGNLYGTTCCGGGYGYGIVFVLKPGKKAWREVVIYAFDGSTNYRDPNGYLTLDSAGNIFGSTTGGSNGCNYQCGMVYRISRSHGQWVLTAVYTFNGLSGASPNGGLILDQSGNFYGSTLLGGKNNFGEVFELKPGKTWSIELRYSFSGEDADENPNPGLIFGPGGGLYGTTPGYYYDQVYGEAFEVLP